MKNFETEFYASPEAEVIEATTPQVICLSTGSTQQYEDGDWNP